MSDTGNAEHDEKPEEASTLTSAKPPAGQSKIFILACSVAFVWTMVLLGFIAAKISKAPDVVATLASVVAIVAFIIGFAGRSKFPEIPTTVLKAHSRSRITILTSEVAAPTHCSR